MQIPQRRQSDEVNEIAIQRLRDRFPFITETEWRSFMESCKVVTLKKGEHFLVQGSPVRKSCFVLSGILKHTRCTEESNETILHFNFDDAFIGDCHSYHNQTPGHFSVTALTSCCLLVIQIETFGKISYEQPGLLQMGIKLSQELLENFAFHAQVLSHKDPLIKYKLVLNRFPEFIQKVALTEIAKYMGVSRETVSRTRLRLLDESRNLCD